MTPQERDQKKLEVITSIFTKAILLYAFEDPKYYTYLAHRLATIIDLEIKENITHETNRELAQFWPNGSLN